MMLTFPDSSFLQIGATRDGLDPYLEASRQRQMKSILIETPDYLQWRHQLGRRKFDLEIPVEEPADPYQILAALENTELMSFSKPNNSLKLVLPGFERYVESAYAVAEILQVYPWEKTTSPYFFPPNKWEQRNFLTQKAKDIRQPAYTTFSLQNINVISSVNLNYPLVIKPVNGGGGLGVFLIENSSQLKKSLAELKKLTNYDGSSFEKIILEEYISGVEHSVQGFAYKGKALILTLCQKFIVNEAYCLHPELFGFREAGHIAVMGSDRRVSTKIRDLTQSCLDAFGYNTGPFHIDLIEKDNNIYFVEMGFRLSGGGLVNLVRRVTGIDWAELSFASYLQNQPPSLSVCSPEQSSGQIIAVSPEEIKKAQDLQNIGYQIDFELFSALKPFVNPSSVKSLAADILRHTGALGRIIVTASDATEVKRLLQMCAPARLVA